ncbi:MAG: ATP-binding protein [Bdellovibrionales bacterium]|nr:ATP-binding protein [Bdellovibrionales bacterium]
MGTIATTNLPFGKFNQIFANDAIAHAIVDRLVNEAEVFTWRETAIGHINDSKNEAKKTR